MFDAAYDLKPGDVVTFGRLRRGMSLTDGAGRNFDVRRIDACIDAGVYMVDNSGADLVYYSKDQFNGKGLLFVSN